MRHGYQATLTRAGAPGLVHAGERWASASWSVVPHSHPVTELFLQLEGEPTQWRVDTASVQVGRLQMLICPPSTSHELIGPAPARWRYLFAAFDPQVLLAGLPSTARSWADGMPLVIAEANLCRDPFVAFLREVNSAGRGRADALTAAAQHLAVTVARCAHNDITAVRRPSTRTGHPAVVRAEALLRARYDEPWTVHDLARAVGMSDSHLAALFVDEVGLSPAACLREIRLRHAEHLLVETDLPIATVATAVGFCSAQHLATVTKSAMGLTPSQIRVPGRS